MVKHLVIFFIVLVSQVSYCFQISAQTVVNEYVSKIVASCVEADYQYDVKDPKMAVKGVGHIVMQGTGYFMTGNGLEVYCDGSSKWTIDREAKEVIIEKAGLDDYVSNPLLLLKEYQSHFRYVSTSSLTIGGKNAIAFVFTPKVGPHESISKVELYFTPDGNNLLGLRTETKKGIVIDVTIPSITFSESLSSNLFSFDLNTLSKDFIITDLR